MTGRAEEYARDLVQGAVLNVLEERNIISGEMVDSALIELADIIKKNRSFDEAQVDDDLPERPISNDINKEVFIPKPQYNNDYPALVIELKWNKTVQTALDQIKEKNYPESISQYTGNILLVAVNYDKKTKQHECMIEPYHAS